METGAHVLSGAVQSVWHQVAEGQEHPQPPGLLHLGGCLPLYPSCISVSLHHQVYNPANLVSGVTVMLFCLISRVCAAIVISFTTMPAAHSTVYYTVCQEMHPAMSMQHTCVNSLTGSCRCATLSSVWSCCTFTLCSLQLWLQFVVPMQHTFRAHLQYIVSVNVGA